MTYAQRFEARLRGRRIATQLRMLDADADNGDGDDAVTPVARGEEGRQ